MKEISHKEYKSLFYRNALNHDIPVIGSFELTPLCNLDCRMCYVHMQDLSVQKQMLSGEQWISIMRDAVRCGMTSVLLTGGEAMTHPDFWMVYDYLLQAGVEIRIKTNGVLLNEKNVKRFEKYPPAGIDISLYGCNRESYLAVTGKDLFDVVSENIKRLADTEIRGRLMIVPSVYMAPWTDEVMEYAKTFGIPVLVNTLLIDTREGVERKKSDYDLSVEELLRIQKKKDELFPPELVVKEENERLYENEEGRPHISEKGLYCNSGRINFAINWDGTMEPCLSFPREVICAYPMRDGFEAAWREVNQAVKNYKVPEKCHSCGYNTRCHYCPIQHGKYSAKNQCDAKVCEFWQKLFESR